MKYTIRNKAQAWAFVEARRCSVWHDGQYWNVRHFFYAGYTGRGRRITQAAYGVARHVEREEALARALFVSAKP